MKRKDEQIKEFKRFLKERGVLNQYLHMTRNPRERVGTAGGMSDMILNHGINFFLRCAEYDQFIGCAFTWDKSPQKWQFWNDLNNMWLIDFRS